MQRRAGSSARLAGRIAFQIFGPDVPAGVGANGVRRAADGAAVRTITSTAARFWRAFILDFEMGLGSADMGPSLRSYRPYGALNSIIRDSSDAPAESSCRRFVIDTEPIGTSVAHIPASFLGSTGLDQVQF